MKLAATFALVAALSCIDAGSNNQGHQPYVSGDERRDQAPSERWIPPSPPSDPCDPFWAKDPSKVFQCQEKKRREGVCQPSEVDEIFQKYEQVCWFLT